MKSPLILAILITAVLAVAVVAINGAFGPDEKHYVAENARVLRVLPKPPGSEATDVKTNAYYKERGPLSNIPMGWTTNAVYRAPEGLTGDEVIEFYLKEMPYTWEPSVQSVPVIDLVTGQSKGSLRYVTFVWGGGRVGLNVDNVDSNLRTFELSIDYKAFRP